MPNLGRARDQRYLTAESRACGPAVAVCVLCRIVLRRHPELDCDITLMGRVVWTGRSSMVINMRQDAFLENLCELYVLFVVGWI